MLLSEIDVRNVIMFKYIIYVILLAINLLSLIHIPLIMYRPSCLSLGRMHGRRLSLNPSLVPDLVLPTTFSVCTKAG